MNQKTFCLHLQATENAETGNTNERSEELRKQYHTQRAHLEKMNAQMEGQRLCIEDTRQRLTRKGKAVQSEGKAASESKARVLKHAADEMYKFTKRLKICEECVSLIERELQPSPADHARLLQQIE